MDAPNRRQPPPPPTTRIPWAALGYWTVALTLLALFVLWLHGVYVLWLSLGDRFPQ